MGKVFYHISTDNVTKYKYIETDLYVISVDSDRSISICVRPNNINDYHSWSNEIGLEQFHFSNDLKTKIQYELLVSNIPDCQFLNKICHRILNLLVFL